MSPSPFRIEVPPLPQYLGTARAFAAAVARAFEALEETVADLELAVSEACTMALSSGEPVRILISVDGAAFEVEVGVPAGSDELEGSDVVAGQELIASLFPGAGFAAGSDGSRVLRFLAPLD